MGGMSGHFPQDRHFAAMNSAVADAGFNFMNAPISRGGFALASVRRVRLRHFSDFIYCPAIIRMNGTILSNHRAYASRLSSSAASYSAPRSRMAAALARCASRNPLVSRTRRSNLFGFVMARSSNSAAWPQSDGDGGATSGGRNGTTFIGELHYAPPGAEFIERGNGYGCKRVITHPANFSPNSTRRHASRVSPIQRVFPPDPRADGPGRGSGDLAGAKSSSAIRAARAGRDHIIIEISHEPVRDHHPLV